MWKVEDNETSDGKIITDGKKYGVPITDDEEKDLRDAPNRGAFRQKAKDIFGRGRLDYDLSPEDEDDLRKSLGGQPFAN